MLYEYTDPVTQTHAPLISEEIYKIIRKNADELDSSLIYDRDYNFDYFGFKTLERSYLIRKIWYFIVRAQVLFIGFAFFIVLV